MRLLGIDVGGTFTDLAILDLETQELWTHKLLTTPEDPVRAVLEGARAVAAKAGGAFPSRVIHGTTLVTNAIVERKGAVTGLLTTQGFRDVLEIRREGRYDLYDLNLDFPEPLVPRRLRFEVTERVDDRGAVLEPLDEASLPADASGVQSWAVCFLHAYANGAHERRAADLLRDAFPGTPVSISSEVGAEIREYERTSTVVANAYVRPIAESYLKNLVHELGSLSRGDPPSIHVMLSDGGLISPETAARHPIRIVESGPAGGVLAAQRLGRSLSLPRVLSLDMGGTTAKIAFLDASGARTRSLFEVDRRHLFKRGSGLPVQVPSLDLVEIGAGGGSLAAKSALGTLVVGPESAGAAPGPACYDRGGTGATVTDADLVLGLLDGDYFLGGAMRLSRERAERAIGEHAARPLGLSVDEAAFGIHRLVGSNMAEAARMHAAERGLDLTLHTLIAFGGAGPVHAWSVARQLRMPRVVFPAHSGVLSALGFLAAPPAFEIARSRTEPLADLSESEVARVLDELAKSARAELAGTGNGDVLVRASADMRYRGQGSEVRVPVAGLRVTREELGAAFERAYAVLYGRAVVGVPVEVVTWRVRAERPLPAVSLFDNARAVEDGARMLTPKRHRRAWLPDFDAPHETPVFRRDELAPGICVPGPALIEDTDSTLVIGRGTARVLVGGAVLAEVEGMILDPVLAGIVWTRLASITEEVATVLLRTSFTPVVREAGDLSAGIFDRRARMIAQAVTGTPGHINTMATAVRHFAERFPLDALTPGDALATNDPWLASGHLHDVTLVSPLFHQGRAVGWCANTCHMADIGGRTLGAEGLDVFEEGLRIPIMKIFERGVMPPMLRDVIAANVRAPEMVLGDLQAMAVANLRAETRLGELLDDLGFADLEGVSESILNRSEAAVRERIRALPDGVSEGEVILDGFESPVTLHAKVGIEGDRLRVDYSGTSGAVREGINVVHTYTHAYTTYALACLLYPDVPHNEGSFRPVTVEAPEGSILNARFPAPVAARHIIGHFLPGAVYAALSGLIPERVPADGAYGLWASQFEGARGNGSRYVFTMFSNGGTGARVGKDGLSATSFPSGVQNIPVEIIESTTPLLVHERALRVGSGGEGTYRGGLGQVLTLSLREGEAVYSTIYERLAHPALGRSGGSPGAPGRVIRSDGQPVHGKKKSRLPAGVQVRIELPGGGGWGDPGARLDEARARDKREGYVDSE